MPDKTLTDSPYAAKLSREIHSYVEFAFTEIPLFRDAKHGRVKAEHLLKYVASATELVRHTPKHLQLAVNESEKRGLNGLAHYFKQKIKEEVGHDQWGEQDSRNIKEKFSLNSSPWPAPEMYSMIEKIEALIRFNPRLYPGYILLAEQFCVEITPRWIPDLIEHCGFSADMISIIGNHGELDKHHIIDGVCEIDALELSPLEQNDCSHAVKSIFSAYTVFCRAIGPRDEIRNLNL